MTESTVDTDEPGTASPEEHLEHRSVWPVVGAAGAATLYAGIALLAITASIGTIPAVLGVAVAVTGAVGFVAGMLGWTDEAFLADYWSGAVDATRNRAYRTTMILFLVTDLATFAVGFVYYFYVRTLAWPPEHLPHLLSSLVLVNTLILLASSVTIHYAHHALTHGNRQRFTRLLGATLLLGVVFVGGQVYEYYLFVVEEGFTVADGVFASAFFGLTGLHGLHVALGAVLIGLLFFRTRRGHYGPDRDTSVATVSLYWHFVDAVWVFLVVVLYVGATL